MDKLSVVIIAKNAANNLDRCLSSLKEFNDVVLLDNESTDETISLANKYPNVRIFSSAFIGMGNLRNLAASYAKYDWIFMLDSDESVSNTLNAAIVNTAFHINIIYSIERHNHYNNQLIKSSGWGNDWVLRIYNRTTTCYSDHQVHERVLSDNHSINKMSGVINHYPYNRISDLISKMQQYSSWYAEQNMHKQKPYLLIIAIRTIVTFLKCYLLKGGWRDGYIGLAISTYNAIGTYSKYIKLYELKNK